MPLFNPEEDMFYNSNLHFHVTNLFLVFIYDNKMFLYFYISFLIIVTITCPICSSYKKYKEIVSLFRDSNLVRRRGQMQGACEGGITISIFLQLLNVRIKSNGGFGGYATPKKASENVIVKSYKFLNLMTFQVLRFCIPSRSPYEQISFSS